MGFNQKMKALRAIFFILLMAVLFSPLCVFFAGATTTSTGDFFLIFLLPSYLSLFS